MNRKAAALVLLFTIGTATALAPLVLVGIGLVAGGITVGAIEYYLGIRPLQTELQEVKEAYESYKVGDYYQDHLVAENTVERMYTNSKIFLALWEDQLRETDGFAWSSMKRIYLDLRAQGYNHSYSKNKALEWLYNLYANRTLTVQEMSKANAQMLCSAWSDMYDTYLKCRDDPNCDESKFEYLYADTSTITSERRSCSNITYQSCSNEFGGRGTYILFTYSDYYLSVNRGYGGNLVYDASEFCKIIRKLTNSYTSLRSNAIVYFDALAQLEINETTIKELLDPITIATQFSTDWNTTGYYRLAAAEAALSGIPVALNSTVCIEYGANEYCGVMFTNWDNVTFTKGSYTVPSGKFVWLITDDNQLIRIGEGETFEITSLTDSDGNPIDSTSVYRYVEHSGDVQKAIEELQKLNELWEEYMKMQAQVSPPSESILDQLTEWWNSLSTEMKLIVVGGVAVGIIAIIYLLRGGGKTAVVVAGR